MKKFKIFHRYVNNGNIKSHIKYHQIKCKNCGMSHMANINEVDGICFNCWMLLKKQKRRNKNTKSGF